jgi:hypothetical protein
MWEVIEYKAVMKALWVGYNSLLESTLKEEVITVSQTEISQILELSEKIKDPSTILQILKIDPNFFTQKHSIITLKEYERINAYLYSLKWDIEQEMEYKFWEEDVQKMEQLIHDGNVLILPERWLSYISDQPYPTLILNRIQNWKNFEVKYSTLSKNYKLNKYRNSIPTSTWSELTLDQIYQIIHCKDSPYIAFAKEWLDGFFYGKDREIKKIK